MFQVSLLTLAIVVAVLCSVVALIVSLVAVRSQRKQFWELFHQINDVRGDIKNLNEVQGRSDREILKRQNEILRQENIIRENAQATRSGS
jgi:hypothetical protein